MWFYLALGFLIVGTVFLLVEAFIPGFGFFGVTGILLILGSSIFTILLIPNGIFLVMGEISLLSFLLYVVLEYIKKKQLYGKIILDETLNFEEKEIGSIDYFLGKEGITKTPLKPFGTVEFNGVRMEVFSSGEFIPKGVSIKVVEVSNNKIYVKQLGTN